jgi:hypothetical protein
MACNALPEYPLMWVGGEQAERLDVGADPESPSGYIIPLRDVRHAQSRELRDARQSSVHGSAETQRTLPQERSLGAFLVSRGPCRPGREKPVCQLLAILCTLPLLLSSPVGRATRAEIVWLPGIDSNLQPFG